jgi:predicted Zn-dependent protease
MAASLLPGCVTNPYTDRSQLLLVSQAQEARLGAQAYRQILSDRKVRLSTDPAEVEPVERVARRVIDAARRSKYADLARTFEWEVVTIKDDGVLNAFCVPGGKIAVYTGIFPVARNEAGLAAIMGHEVVHALARHGAERMSQGVVANVGLAAAGIALGTSGVSGPVADVTMQALGLGTQVGVLLPFSREHESEADYVGLLLAAEAGYDPREAVRVWERMSERSKGQPPEFLSTHPGHGTRIRKLEGWMPEALALYRPDTAAPAAELPAITGGGR